MELLPAAHGPAALELGPAQVFIDADAASACVCEEREEVSPCTFLW